MSDKKACGTCPNYTTDLPKATVTLPTIKVLRELRDLREWTGDATTLPTDSEERKHIPIYRAFFQYFPAAIAEVARLSAAANEKHNPGEEIHWNRPKSDDHYDCLLRHMLESGTMDDDGFLHDVKVAWRAMANLQLELEKRGAPAPPRAVD